MNNKIATALKKFKVIITFFLFLLISSCQNHYSYDQQMIPLEPQRTILDETDEEFNTEEYDRIYDNPFRDALNEPLSTFSIDVDNAAYSNVRRFLNSRQLPPKDAVRVEEMINYFTYDYPQPKGRHPFAIQTETASCPWNQDHKLVHIGIQGKSINYEELAPSNLVFLIDASGSMSDRNKLPLLKNSLSLLLNELSPKDRVAIVAYAGSAGLVLPSTPASEQKTILRALNQISSGGSTAGGQGIQLAYSIAEENLVEGGNNRVILATDGDFNVGVSSTSDLVRLIEEKRQKDIYLTICGFGMGNYKDGRMEQISNAGNGNYFYIDNIREAKKVFVTEMRANMYTIARDVKIQIEFNPRAVKSYRLIGYENRVMDNQDFADDKKDAGELGAGHTVTALYEIVPNTQNETGKTDLKYQKTVVTSTSDEELLTVKFRYKPLDSDESILIVSEVDNRDAAFESASTNFRFSAAVAGFGMLLRDSEYKGTVNYRSVLKWSNNAKGSAPEGNRAEFIQLVNLAEELAEVE